MPPATTLREAASAAYDNCVAQAASTNLQVAVQGFWTDLNTPGLFDEQRELDHPVINWIALIAALADNLSAPTSTITEIDNSAQYLYRICFLGYVMVSASQISSAQATAILDAYNNNIV